MLPFPSRPRARGYALATALLLLASAGAATAQTVVYREIFGNANTSLPSSIGTAGWLLARGSTGLLDYATATAGLRKATFTGSPTNLPSVDSAANPLSTLSSGAIQSTINSGSNDSDTTQTTGYFIRATGSAAKSLMFTSEFAIDRDAQEISSISFYLGSANLADTVRVAVQIGSSWFVTSTTFADTVVFNAGTSNFEKQTFTWTTDAAAWNSLDFTAGSSLSMGGLLSENLPAGDVTAFGLYYDFANANLVSFDTYEIQTSAVPEPATCSALAGALALLAAVCRRRRGHA